MKMHSRIGGIAVQLTLLAVLCALPVQHAAIADRPSTDFTALAKTLSDAEIVAQLQDTRAGARCAAAY